MLLDFEIKKYNDPKKKKKERNTMIKLSEGVFILERLTLA